MAIVIIANFIKKGIDSMIYALTPTVNKLNARLKQYEENYGKNSWRANNLRTQITQIVPEDYLDGAKIRKPETLLKNGGQFVAEDLKNLLDNSPTPEELYWKEQKRRKAVGDQQETRKEYKSRTKRNAEINATISESLDKLYKYKNGKRIAKNKSAQKMINYLRKQHKSQELIEYIADNIETLTRGRRIPTFKGVTERGIY